MGDILNYLKDRGLVHDVSHFDDLAKTLNSQSVTFYCGFDPTADSLHVGSMLPLLVMRRFQNAGHKPLVILGSGTGMIGDPSGKSAERKLLTDEEIDHNVQGLQKQVSLFLDATGNNGFSIHKNDTWLRAMTCIDFLRDVGKHFSVNAMMVKDSVKSRLTDREQGISYTEFSYMLLQAYDFYYLYKHHGCLLQVGGSDQWGNITAGIDFIRRKEQSGTSPVFGLTFPLLTTSSGNKFGKTEQGNVWLDPQRTSPYRFYQFWLSTKDADVIRYLKLFTDEPDESIIALEGELKSSPEKRGAQRRLAETLTEIVHGTEGVRSAVQASEVLFGGSITNVPLAMLKDIFADVPSTNLSRQEIGSGIALSDLLVRCEGAKSKGEAKRLIDGGGVYINNERATDAAAVITAAAFIENSLLILRLGKKRYHLVALQ